MTIEMAPPDPDGLREVVRALREWQVEGGPDQLHPGDIGWYWRFGTDLVAAAVRTWNRDGRLLAAALLDGPELFRFALAPEAFADEELARQLLDDLSDPGRVVPEGKVSVEVPTGARIRDLLLEDGWNEDDPWQPVRRDLTGPVPDPGVRVELVGPELAPQRAAVQRAAFEGSTFTEDRWHAMASGPAYQDARCLLAFTPSGDPAAAVTVWSAGPGRPGYLEPMGVEPAHRGHGYGRAICTAAAATLRDFGASSAVTCTPGSNTAAIATYKSAGFNPLAPIRGLYRTT